MVSRRGLVNVLWFALMGAGAVLALLPMGLVLAEVIRAGLPGWSWALFTQLPGSPGENGGLANAILGTVEMLALAVAVGLPPGLAGGLYLAESGHEKIAAIVRLGADILNGVPTIVIGLLVYALVVAPMHRFSGLAGGLALALILLPLMLRASEEALKRVPRTYREAAAALGASPAQVRRGIVLRVARPALAGAALLGMARVAGETAPLLFTALNNAQWAPLNQPTASLPVQIYNDALGPYAAWHRQAWAGALVLLAIMALLMLGARRFGTREEA